MFFTCSKCSWCLASSVATTLASSSSPALSLTGEHALSTTSGRGCWQNINHQLDHSDTNCFLYLYSNHYPPNAPNTFISPPSERTISVRCGHLMLCTLMQRPRIIAPLVISTLCDGLWSDSCSGHFTQLCTYARHE